jgi:hypothetical protein
MVGIIHPGHISESLVKRMKRTAATGTYDGQLDGPARGGYFGRCVHYCRNTAARLIYTRDVGMHGSGWWKNPDYNQCLHLSISFAVIEGRNVFPLPQDHKAARRWCEAIFGHDTKLLWIEPPFSAEGKASDVWHYRLFCDPAWEPIKPRGEVYNTDWTPADWKSWSDIHGVKDGDGAFGTVIEKEGA